MFEEETPKHMPIASSSLVKSRILCFNLFLYKSSSISISLC